MTQDVTPPVYPCQKDIYCSQIFLHPIKRAAAARQHLSAPAKQQLSTLQAQPDAKQDWYGPVLEKKKKKLIQTSYSCYYFVFFCVRKM